MTRILVVCLGNICRSPLAHGILESKLPKDRFSVDSAGTAAYHIGKNPDHRSIQVAKNNGIDISGQHARQFKVSDFDTFDYIYAMDQSNYSDIISLARNSSDIGKVKLILNESHPSKNLEVPDPYYSGESGFDTVYIMLEKACDALSKKLNN
jgi:protein-tyrosine phosphatase